MFAESLTELARADRLFDVCLVGSGPAGITLATELDRRGLSVLLLEAGSAQFDADSQAMLQAEVVGPLRFDATICRARCFGGSSTLWGGFCRPLDAADFHNKVEGIDTAWPITRDDLDPFLARAEAILDLPPATPDEPWGNQLMRTSMRYSPPVNFAVKYRPFLARSAHTVVALDACVVDLQERGGAIAALQVCGPDGTRHRLRARRIVLCAGGIENSRLLLWANARHGGRVVSEPRTLGRYWFEHPHFTLGEAWLQTASDFQFDRWSIAWAAPSESAMREQGLLNVGLRLTRQPREASRELAVRMACVAPELARTALSRMGRRLSCGVLLRASWEQAPQPWNRVVLSTTADRYGVPRAELHWRLGEPERHSARGAALLLAAELARRNGGRVRLDPWVLGRGGFPADDEIKGNHHMGGTRMSRHPHDGVVDPNGRVHGCANLYVAGSSVFPSGGAANPTLTIVQLALRLADHLAANSLPAKSA